VGGTGGIGAAPGDCYYYGTYYQMGDEFIPDDDPCTSCICNNLSRVICGERDCTTCVYEGLQHPINASFPAKDGCNSCNCDERGNVYCGHAVCEPSSVCLDLQAKFAEEVAAQKSCPSRPDDSGCVLTALDSLPCGCNTAVRSALTLDAIAAEYYADGCGGDPLCPPCNNGGVAFCSEGTCVLGGYL
jgi:hypothetical protein